MTPTTNLLTGGPAEGMAEAQHEGRLWTIIIVHGNCACDWCKEFHELGIERVAHVYERRDDDVFAYRRSEEATQV